MHTRNTILLLLLLLCIRGFQSISFRYYTYNIHGFSCVFVLIYIGAIASFRNSCFWMHFFRSCNKDERWLYLIWFALVYCIKLFYSKFMQMKQDSKIKKIVLILSSAIYSVRIHTNKSKFTFIFVAPWSSFLVPLIFIHPTFTIYVLCMYNVYSLLLETLAVVDLSNWRWLNSRIHERRTFQWDGSSTHWKWTNGTHNSKPTFYYLIWNMKRWKVHTATECVNNIMWRQENAIWIAKL